MRRRIHGGRGDRFRLPAGIRSDDRLDRGNRSGGPPRRAPGCLARRGGWLQRPPDAQVDRREACVGRGGAALVRSRAASSPPGRRKMRKERDSCAGWVFRGTPRCDPHRVVWRPPPKADAGGPTILHLSHSSAYGKGLLHNSSLSVRDALQGFSLDTCRPKVIWGAACPHCVHVQCPTNRYRPRRTAGTLASVSISSGRPGCCWVPNNPVHAATTSSVTTPR